MEKEKSRCKSVTNKVRIHSRIFRISEIYIHNKKLDQKNKCDSFSQLKLVWPSSKHYVTEDWRKRMKSYWNAGIGKADSQNLFLSVLTDLR